jgi:glucokinase
MKRLVGIDLGGTSIRAAVATGPASYDQERRAHRDTPATDGPEAVLGACAEAAIEAAGGAPDGIAIGIPGPLDPRSGIVFAAPHLKGWEGVPAQRLLEQAAGCPVAIHNDSNLAGYAEWVAGTGQGTRNFIFVIAGTGIGGALVVDGELYSGAAGTAAEVGHTPCGLDGPVCGQGHRGCLEGMASGSAIANRTKVAIASGEPSSLRDRGGDITTAIVAEAARAGDDLARRIFADAGRALGRAFGGLINVFGPDAIAIGGGLVNTADLLMPPLKAAIGELAFAVAAQHCRVEPAALGPDAGLVGAVAWAVRRFPD